MKNNGQNGFTLIELLLVVVIIGVIVTIAVIMIVVTAVVKTKGWLCKYAC